MRKRRRLTRRGSRKVFKKGLRVKKRNYPRLNMRGGIRA